MQIITEPSSCASGAYTLETLVPINADKTAGEIKINGILFSYQSDGSVTATLDGKPAAINTSGNASCTASGQ